jgi:broad-specificity NMP kinase
MRRVRVLGLPSPLASVSDRLARVVRAHWLTSAPVVERIAILRAAPNELEAKLSTGGAQRARGKG